jgi:hypothetical protein
MPAAAAPTPPQSRLLLLLLLAVILLPAGTSAFLLPLRHSPQSPSRTKLFSTTITAAAATSSSLQQSHPQQQQQQQQRVRFEGFSLEEGAAAGDTITVVYCPRAPGLGALMTNRLCLLDLFRSRAA